MEYDRRTILQGSLTAAGLALIGAQAAAQTQNWSAPDADVPSATLKSMVFQSKRLDASTADYRKWYIEGHGPDYLSFAAPYLERYSRMFVEKSYRGPVDFDCVSELALPSREAGLANAKALDSAEGRAALARHPKIGTMPGPNEAHNGKHRFSVDERLLSGPPRGYDEQGLRKQLVLIRRKGAADAEAFLHALTNYGSGMARDRKDAIYRLVLNLAVPEPKREAPMYDAAYLIWPNSNANLATAFAAPPPEADIVNIVDVVTYEPDLAKL